MKLLYLRAKVRFSSIFYMGAPLLERLWIFEF